MQQPAIIQSPNQLPPTRQALRSPDGLLAVGGAVTVEFLTAFYPQGVFPCYGEQEPVLWWSPWQRWVLMPEELRINRSLQKSIARHPWRLDCNQQFQTVIQHCAAPRSKATGSWLNRDLQQSMIELHHQGLAHSIELYRQDQLLGGFYGLKIGAVFFGESMFSLARDASKIALALFCQQQPLGQLKMIDCQQHTAHTAAMGAKCLTRNEFESLLQQWISQ